MISNPELRLIYRLYVLENIRRGQEDAEKSKTTLEEQV